MSFYTQNGICIYFRFEMTSKTEMTPEGFNLGDEGKKDFRQMCKYGASCYQKNPMHHQKFRHPAKTNAARENEAATLEKDGNQKENINSDANNGVPDIQKLEKQDGANVNPSPAKRMRNSIVEANEIAIYEDKSSEQSKVIEANKVIIIYFTFPTTVNA